MARDKGQSKFSSNFEVKIAEMLDPRLLVDTKEELINKETWPFDGNTIYMKEGMFVYVKGDGFYELVSLANILATDYSGWKKVTSGAEGGSDVYFSDLLTPRDISYLASGTSVTVDESKVADFITNAKDKVVVFYRNDEVGYDSIIIHGVEIYDGGMYFTYCGFDSDDSPTIAWIYYSSDDHTFYRDRCFKAGDYQPLLESGKNIKTINGEGVLGRGNITVQPSLISGTNIKTVNNMSLLGRGNINVQPVLQSGATIKTINGTSVLGGGNISVQSSLVSGTNIKTINGNGILGEGNLAVKAYYPKTFVTIDEFPESVTLIPTEYTIINTVIDGGFTISCKGSANVNKRADEHLIRFSYSSGSISFGNNIRWQNEAAPTFKSGYTYEISILDGLACFAEFKTA